jgi:hypothetical protein
MSQIFGSVRVHATLVFRGTACKLSLLQGGDHAMPTLHIYGQGVSTGVALRQRAQQCLRLLQVGSVKAFGEPVVDWR